jgi:hypothetical protein
VLLENRVAVSRFSSLSGLGAGAKPHVWPLPRRNEAANETIVLKTVEPFEPVAVMPEDGL